MDCTVFCIHSHCPEALSQEATAFQYLAEAKWHFQPDICSSKNHLSSLSYEGWACTFALAEEYNRNIGALPNQTHQSTCWQLGLLSGGKVDLFAYCIFQERIPQTLVPDSKSGGLMRTDQGGPE